MVQNPEVTGFIGEFGKSLPDGSVMEHYSNKVIKQFLGGLFSLGETSMKTAMKRCAKEWGAWAISICEGGARKAHQFTKHRIIQLLLESLWAGEKQGVPHPKDAADHEMNKWVDIWGIHKCVKTVMEIFEHIECPPLPLMTVGDLDTITHMYPDHTGVGGMGYTPRWVTSLRWKQNRLLWMVLTSVRSWRRGRGCSTF